MSIDLLAPKPEFTTQKIYDPIEKPYHYNQFKYEPIEVIIDWKLDYFLGNVIKYVARADYKGMKLQDLKKARWYLNKKIEQLQDQEKQGHAEFANLSNLHNDHSDLSSEKGTGVLGPRTSI